MLSAICYLWQLLSVFVLIGSFGFHSGFYMPVVYARCVWWLGSYICCLCSFGFTVGSLLLLHAGCVYCSSILFMSAVLWLSIWSFLVDRACHNRNIMVFCWLENRLREYVMVSLFRLLTGRSLITFECHRFFIDKRTVSCWWFHCGCFIVAGWFLIYVYSWNILMF